MSVIERFVVLMYDKTSNHVKVNQARQDLFPKRCVDGFTINHYHRHFHRDDLC